MNYRAVVRDLFSEATKKGTTDEQVKIMNATVDLAACVLGNLDRIADALEQIAENGLPK